MTAARALSQGGGSASAAALSGTVALVIGEGGAEHVADRLVEMLEPGPAGTTEALRLAHRLTPQPRQGWAPRESTSAAPAGGAAG